MATFSPPIENRNSKIENPPDLHPILLRHLTFPIYAGHLTLIVGDPGVGKSLLALDLAARAANGAPYPPTPANTPFPERPLGINDDRPFQPGQVIYLSAENPDLFHHAVNCFGIPPQNFPAPRIEHQSAVPLRSAIYEKSRPHEEDSPLLAWLKDQSFNNLRLLILDPFPVFIGSLNTSAYTLRQRITPLLDYAQRRRFALIGISHVVKHHRATDPVHLSLGSTGFTMLARSVLYLTHDSTATIENRNSKIENPSSPSLPQCLSASVPSCARRLLVPIKNNLAPLNAAYTFSFQDRAPDPRHLDRTVPPELVWEPDPITNHPLLRDARFNLDSSAPLSEDQAIKQAQLERACDFINDLLKDGPVPSAKLYEHGPSLGLSPKTIERARNFLHIRAFKVADHWCVALPNPTAPS